jgi:hypothetical protein
MALPRKNSRQSPLPSIEDMVRELVAEPDKWLCNAFESGDGFVPFSGTTAQTRKAGLRSGLAP